MPYTPPLTTINGEVPQGPGGVAPLPAVEVPEAPPMRRREVWAEVPEYPGWMVKLWANFPARLFDDVKSGDNAKIAGALKDIVLAHNGWKDDKGVPFPPADVPEFWEAIPTELAALLLIAIREEATRLPNSLLATRRS